MKRLFLYCFATAVMVFTGNVNAQRKPLFKAIAFFMAKEDLAHISFVHEANDWFASAAKRYNFTYDTTSNWNNLRTDYLKQYQVVLLLDTRPEAPQQRQAFEQYMRKGGGWLGFHFSAFALTPSAYAQNWDWYHNDFLGSGSYGSNTWRPTSAMLRIENEHPVTKGIPHLFKASPNEWYRWENDLRKNKDIRIIAAIDSSSFPLGTGPKAHEIWHSGYYPVVWTNVHYRMVYFNMGHNDMDYEGGTNATLSHTFANETQNRLVINSLFWAARQKPPR